MSDQKTPVVPPAVRLLELGKTRGFAFGFVQECAFARIEISEDFDSAGLVGRLDTVLRPYLPVSPNFAASEEPLRQFAHCLLGWVAALQQAAGIPVVSDGKIMSLKRTQGASQRSDAVASLAMPSLIPEAAANSLSLLVLLARDIPETIGSDGLPPEQRTLIETQFEKLRKMAPSGNNAPHLVRAAMSLDIPVARLPKDTFQLGWGKRARLFNSTASDTTSMIGAMYAMDKIASTNLMRRSGIPVPRNAAAPTREDALAAANEIGFPVVVKPIDQERGTGVTIDVDRKDKLERAYRDARKSSPNVMVEQQVTGHEYRLLIVNGELFWAFERVPAGVTGNGSSTVRELIHEENKSRGLQKNTGLNLVAIKLDKEALKLLERSELTLDSVPEADRFVRLQIVPRINGGGQVIPVFDHVHPDNAAIACRAARLVRLDIAGIDFLSPDISRSWRDVGGYITEINAQPQVSPLSKSDIYQQILAQYVEGNGRVPVALVVGDDGGVIEQAVRQDIAATGLRVGLATGNRVTLGEEELASGEIDPFDAAEMLILEPATEMIVLCCENPASLSGGIPFDRIDMLVVANTPELTGQSRGSLKSISQHLAGSVLSIQDSATKEDLERIFEPAKMQYAGSAGELAGQMCKALLGLTG